MKTLHKYIIKAFLPPLVMNFCISVFVFFMVFIFVYIDDLVGKGIDTWILCKLFFFAALKTFPQAIPLSILLSSLMTMGNLGERNELIAMKSAGLSLNRIMLPLTVLVFFLTGFAFYFSNNILPLTNLKMNAMFYDIREAKPALSIKEGTFYNGIDGFSIRIGKKEKDGNTLRDIIIYDHTAGLGNTKVIFAKAGSMQMSGDKSYLILALQDGYSYEDMLNRPDQQTTRPMIRSKFKEEVVYMDLSGFKLMRTDEELFKSQPEMMNALQLRSESDTVLQKEKRRIEDAYKHNLLLSDRTIKYHHLHDSLHTLSYRNDLLSVFPKEKKIQILETASNLLRSAKAVTEELKSNLEEDNKTFMRYQVEMHKKFTFSLACLLLFFIGAPLGAIIRKGGIGMPVVVSVIFYLIFHILSITGEKSVKEGAMSIPVGMWMATAVLIPLCIFFTKKATKDAALFDVNHYIVMVKRFFIKTPKAN